MSDKQDSRPLCKYGETCYRKNPDHLKQFKHPKKRKASDEMQNGAKKATLNKSPEHLDKSPDSSEKETVTEESPEHHDKSPDSPKKQTVTEEIPAHDDMSEENPIHDDDGDSDDIPSSPADPKENIQQKFLLEMPEDFYSFWDFCKTLNSAEPDAALKDIGLLLVGPYDALSGKLSRVTSRKLDNYLRHWRYYYDPPEFQTILKGDNESGYHMGYFRDVPSDPPVFVAANSAERDCVIKPVGGNVFGAVSSYISSELKKADPMKRMKLTKIQNSLKKWSEEKEYNLSGSTPEMRKRSLKTVAKSFHGAGVVVPYDKKTQVGYREIPESMSNLKKMFKNIVEAKNDTDRQQKMDVLQDEVLVNVHFANDEGDPGMGLELGLDMFSYGGEVMHKMVIDVLSVSYDLLQRETFLTILKAHLRKRKKGSSLSIIPDDERCGA